MAIKTKYIEYIIQYLESVKFYRIKEEWGRRDGSMRTEIQVAILKGVQGGLH